MTGSERMQDRISIRYGNAGVAWLSLPAGSVGVAHLEGSLAEDLDDGIAEVREAAEEGRVRALVLDQLSQASAGRQGLATLLQAGDPREVVSSVLNAQATLRRLERLPIPTIAAIEGDCIGALLELTLACSYRLATTTPSARFALPQIRLGLIPGLGGTVRLPRLIGVEAGLHFILRGEIAGPERAKEIGLVDGLMSPTRFRESVTSFAEERVQLGRLRTRPRRGVPRRLLEDTAPGRRLLFSRASRAIGARKTGREVERAVLQSVADGLSLPLDEAFAREAELYSSLLSDDTSKSLIQASLLEGEASHPHPHSRAGVERVAILGAEGRAAHIAWLLARQGIALRLKDRDRANLAATAASLAARLADRETRRLRGYGGAERSGNFIEAAAGFGGFGAVQLVLSPHDDPERTASELGEAERHVTDRCLLASGSALVQVTEFESALRGPSRALGLILGEAPDLFPAIEIAAGSSTSPEAIAIACELVRRIGGTPIHVGDHPGFLINRLVAIFLWQAAVLVQEGAGIERVDGVAEAFGFRMGPFKRADAIGADGVRRLLMIMPEAISATESIPPLLEWVARRDVRFYRYLRGRAVGMNADLPLGLENGSQIAANEILERLLLAILNEVARSLDQGVVASTADADLATVFGLGYPRSRGGLLFQADRVGLEKIEAQLERRADAHGVGFAPAPLVRALAAAGERFHARR